MTDDTTVSRPDLEGPYVRLPDATLSSYADQYLDEVAAIPEHRATVGCVIPAYNEAETIAGVLDSLLMQTRLPDVIHVIINNTSEIRTRLQHTHTHTHTSQVE